MKISFLAVALSTVALSSSAFAQSTSREAQRAELLRERGEIDARLRALDAEKQDVVPVATPMPTGSNDEIIVTGQALSLTTRVTGQTVTTIDDTAFRNTPATTIADIVRLSPGVAVIQGNGPRDVGVSIRGSNARNGFGARNIQVFEDDFRPHRPACLWRG